jgi:hypothetical protein
VFGHGKEKCKTSIRNIDTFPKPIFSCTVSKNKRFLRRIIIEKRMIPSIIDACKAIKSMCSLVPLLDRNKAYLPTMVGGRVLWHLSYTKPTSAVAFTQSYGECQYAAAQQESGNRVREVLIGAFDSTSTSVRSLCPGACLGSCLSHAVNYASQLRPVKLSYWACWRTQRTSRRASPRRAHLPAGRQRVAL